MGSISLDPRLKPPEADIAPAPDNEALPEPSEVLETEQVSVPVAVDIPYAFARANGVVPIEAEDGRPAVALREGADPAVLIEVRRHVGQPFAIRKVSALEFDRFLHARYAVDQSAAGLAGAIDSNDELNALATGIPTAEDLLDSADDAPAIRLINGIIAEAVRRGVSDIHIEP